MSKNLVRMQEIFGDGSDNAITRFQRIMESTGGLSKEALAAVNDETGLPPAATLGVATFYEDFKKKPIGPKQPGVCNGTACWADSVDNKKAAACHAIPDATPVACLGLCHQAPTCTTDKFVEPVIESHGAETIVLRHMLGDAACDYSALKKACGMAPRQVIDQITRSQLRGRGGAGFPSGIKLKTAADTDAQVRYIVCNADEGDPGSYIDKLLMERDPGAVIEGMAIAAHAIDAKVGYLYLRSEYPGALKRIVEEVDQVTRAGLLGEFEIKIFVGAGAYICGEETALLRSLEGLRGEVTARPPFPAVSGLYGKPTVVNNVETLANFGWIVEHGGDAYAAIGHDKSRGTKAVCLNSIVARPGIYEVDLGTPIATIVNEYAGGLRTGSRLKGIQIGGPLGGILPPHQMDAPLGFEELAAAGCLLGHGGMVVFDQRTDMLQLAEHLWKFCADESCGKCVPCRIGSVRAWEMTQRLLREGQGAEQYAPLMEELCDTLEATSLCALGGAIPAPIQSILTHYKPDLEKYGVRFAN